MIFYVFIKTEKTVHAGVLGFTNYVDYFVIADNEQEAGEKVVNYIRSKYKIESTCRSVSKAVKQSLEAYVFPEAIIR